MTMELVARWAKLAIAFVVVWVLIWAFNTHGCRTVEGGEMEPFIKRDSREWLSPGLRSPEQLARGDVVAYRWVKSGQRQQNFAARVVALPGDRVKIVKGEFFLNGARVKEDFVQANQRSSEDFEEIVVPAESVFVLCDNRRHPSAQDSRRIGPLSKWAIAGKVR